MFVYVLKSIRYDRFYIGLTGDVDRRFYEHNSGWVNKTKFYKPFILVHVEIVKDRIGARKFEKYFKSGYGKEILNEIAEELKT